MKGKKLKVKQFIERLVLIKSHFTRNGSKCQYLGSELTITQLALDYNNNVEDEYKVKQSYVRAIFRKEYNISFGTPTTDKCSKCIELKEGITVANRNIEQIRLLKIEIDVHKKHGEAFFNLLKEELKVKLLFHSVVKKI